MDCLESWRLSGFQVMSFNISECPTFWMSEWYDCNHICYLQWNRKVVTVITYIFIIPRFHSDAKIKISTTLFRISHAINFIILDNVIKWKHYWRYWPFVRRINRLPVNSPHKGQWRGPLLFPLICGWINGWVNNREAGDLRRHRSHYDITVIITNCAIHFTCPSCHVVFTYGCLSFSQVYPIPLTHWRRDKMATISQTTSLQAFFKENV